MENLYYVVGVHGSGKTTLVNHVVDGEFIQMLPRVERSIQYDDPFIRAFMRLSKYFEEYQQHTQKGRMNPDTLFIGDRCVYDTLVYVNAYLNLGWINPEHKETIYRVYQLLWMDEVPPNIIFLDPPVEWVIQRINQRWAKSTKGWREDDFGFLNEVMISYKRFFGEEKSEFRKNLLIVKETDLEDRVRAVKDFLTLDW